MYCINCGVKLVDTETVCPLCRMPVTVPEGVMVTGAPLYPRQKYPEQAQSGRAFPVMMTVLSVLAIIVVILCDLSGGSIGWCGYAIGGLVTAYVGLVLPAWFRNPNPVIFTPCFFGAAILYLLYIDLTVRGGWFLPFALPVTGLVGLIVTTMVTLLRYLRRGWLYIIGGCTMGFGGLAVLVELLLMVAFPAVRFIGWSVYPAVALAILGGFLIFLGICRPAREIMARKFFF